MFPCSALPPPLYPGVLRAPAALSSPLSRSLPSGFLVEDLLRLSQPVGYIHRTFSSRSPGDILSLRPGPGSSPRTAGPGIERSGQPSRGSPVSPHTSSTDYLKFGVSTILAPSTQAGECLLLFSFKIIILKHKQKQNNNSNNYYYYNIAY